MIDYQSPHHSSQVYHHAAPAIHHSAPVYHHAAPVAIKKIIHEDHHAPAEYSFEYSVHDDHTGDIKSQQETRKGDHVQGHYSLIDSDGHRRVVHYSDDGHSGFIADVKREPLGHHHQQPVVKHIAAIPAVAKLITPVHHAPTHHSYSHAPATLQKSSVHSHTIATAPVYHKTISSHQNSQNHVSFSGTGHNYHY